ncbi:MAG TPA: DNA polymerase III subunit gamma/tau [Candidatus Coprenecus stercoripullorum]|nr:DNA polymerase III subunit gamma/tau [Candidatus Coprenecus stercoripullorum]
MNNPTSFIVSARKYRPEGFGSLIGQENIARTLRNSIIRGQLAHAYLFCGPRGVGKTTTARIFAKSINCLDPGPDMEPCGKCESCLSFAEGRSYCIHELDAASNNSVDDIRRLTEIVRIPPQTGKYSVFIIDEVHMLSTAAFNAFLKTLEEPPAHAVFILATTEKHKILPTILSRCQTFDFNRITVPDIIRNLSGIAEKESITIDGDSLHTIAVKGDGSMRDALTLFDQTVAFCGKDIRYADVARNLDILGLEYYFDIIDNSLKGDYIASMLLFDSILAKGYNALHFISGLSSHLRDLIVCKGRASSALLSVPPSFIKRYEGQADACTVQFLYSALEISTACEAAYRQSGNQRLLVEFTLMRLAHTEQGQGTKAAVTLPSARAAVPAGGEKAENDRKPVPAPPDKGKMPGLSIKDMMKKAESLAGNSGNGSDNITDSEITAEEVETVWKALAENEKNSNRKSLGAAMLLHPIKTDEEQRTVTFYVSNSAQQEWIQEKALTRIEGALRGAVRNSRMRVIVEVLPDSGEKKQEILYTPTQKAGYMLSRSEEMRELKKDLDLDIK